MSETEQQLTKAQVAALAVKGTAANMRHARDFFNRQRDKLFSIIIRTAGEDGIREAYKETDNQVKFPYFALKGTHTTKKGVEIDCWKSVWGKYAGKYVEGKPTPILTGYKSYNEFKEEDLLWDAETKSFFILPIKETVLINYNTVDIAYSVDELAKLYNTGWVGELEM